MHIPNCEKDVGKRVRAGWSNWNGEGVLISCENVGKTTRPYLIAVEKTFCGVRGFPAGMSPYLSALVKSSQNLKPETECHWADTYEVLGDRAESNSDLSIMTNIVDFFRNLNLSGDDKLLLEMGLENPTGVPTEQALKLSQEMTYNANREKIIELAKKMKAQQEEEKKKTESK